MSNRKLCVARRHIAYGVSSFYVDTRNADLHFSVACFSAMYTFPDPEEIQLKIFRSMKGLEKVEIVRPGYDVEYGESFAVLRLHFPPAAASSPPSTLFSRPPCTRAPRFRQPPSPHAHPGDEVNRGPLPRRSDLRHHRLRGGRRPGDHRRGQRRPRGGGGAPRREGPGPVRAGEGRGVHRRPY